MNINPLSQNIVHLLNSTPLIADESRLTSDGQTGGSFADILTESFAAVGITDAADKASALELMMGQSDDLSGLLLDMQKAELSLNLALQIRNKIIDAYNEVMRMSV